MVQNWAYIEIHLLIPVSNTMENGKCFFPDAGRNIFPVDLGNMAVGRVTEVGSSVNRF